MKDATEVTYPPLLNTLLKMVLNLKKTIPIELKTKDVHMMLAKLYIPLKPKLLLNQTHHHNYKPLLLNNLFQSVQKLIHLPFNSIPQVSQTNPAAELIQTTAFCLQDIAILVLANHIGQLKTHGEVVGETKDIFGYSKI